jgi:S1-C subfamily serine protease
MLEHLAVICRPAVVRHALAAATLLGALAVQGCVQPGRTNGARAANAPVSKLKEIKINGVAYSTPAAALEARSAGQQKYLSDLARDADPIQGKARIIIPDADRLRPWVAQTMTRLAKRPVVGEALDFEVQMERLDNRAAAEAIEKSGTFESATIIEQNDVRDPPLGDADYLVWFQVRTLNPDNTGAWIGRWQIRRHDNPQTTGAGFDTGVAAGTPRYASFAKSVREAALRLGGTSLAAGLAGTQPASDKARRTVTSGSGIVIATDGHVVTNDHVVRSCAAVQVVGADGESRAAKVLAHDVANDLAILKTPHHWPAAAALREARDVRPGDAVVVTGFPLPGLLGTGMSVTAGTVTALTGPRDDSRLLQLSATVQSGNSGGPLLDSRGNVIGVVSGTLNSALLAIATGNVAQNVNFAIKSAVLRNFLDAKGVGYSTSLARQELSAADVGNLARKFTVKVDCQQ